MVFFGVVNFSLRRYTFDYTTVISRFSVSFGVDFHCREIFTSRTCVKFTFADEIEAMYERSHVSVDLEVKPCSTSCLISTLYILPLFYLYD